jgi:hypothetical protein
VKQKQIKEELCASSDVFERLKNFRIHSKGTNSNSYIMVVGVGWRYREIRIIKAYHKLISKLCFKYNITNIVVDKEIEDLEKS